MEGKAHGEKGVLLAVAKKPTHSDGFATVESGWDPAQVREFIRSLTSDITLLEQRLVSAEARGAARAAETATRVREEIMAAAEHRADDIHGRALSVAKRLRTRGREEGREITVQARRDALSVVKHARTDADRVVGIARTQEAVLWERVQGLQAVVRRTESLLREVADNDFEDIPQVLPAEPDPSSDRVRVVVAAEQSRVGRRLQNDSPEKRTIPDSVERLLNALRSGGRTDA